MMKTYETPVLTKAGSVESLTHAYSNVTGAAEAAKIDVNSLGKTDAFVTVDFS